MHAPVKVLQHAPGWGQGLGVQTPVAEKTLPVAQLAAAV